MGPRMQNLKEGQLKVHMDSVVQELMSLTINCVTKYLTAETRFLLTKLYKCMLHARSYRAWGEKDKTYSLPLKTSQSKKHCKLM